MTGIEIVLLAALGAVLGWTLITRLVLTITMIAAHHDDASHHGPLTPVLDAEGLPVVRTVGDLTPRHIGRQVRIADPVDGDSEGEMTGIDAWPGFFTVWLDQSTAIRCPPRYPARGAAVSRPDRQGHMHSDWGWCSLAAGNRGFCPGGIVDSYLDHSDKRVEGWSTVIHPTWGALLAAHTGRAGGPPARERRTAMSWRYMAARETSHGEEVWTIREVYDDTSWTDAIAPSGDSHHDLLEVLRMMLLDAERRDFLDLDAGHVSQRPGGLMGRGRR